MRITTDRLIRLRWLLLSAVSAGACGGTVHTAPDDGGSGGEAVAGSRNAHAGGAATTGGEETMGGEAASAGPGGGGGRSAGGSAAAGGFGGSGLVHGECVDPQPYGAGFVTCANGLIHRVAKLECANTLPAEPVTCGVEPNQFVCDGKKREHCGNEAFEPISCEVGCAVDADCAASQICLCGGPTGVCVAATCTLDADCTDGSFCRRVQTAFGVGCGATVSFQCELPSDACASSADCDAAGLGERCQPAVLGGPLRCEPVEGVACGRPFLVNGAPRVACLAANTDWAASLELDASALDGLTRAALAEGWNQLGLMEHASVAAFARFTLQLLGLGAPHALVLDSNRALCDETRHAELCFGLAASFGSLTAGPGQLDSHGALARSSLDDVVLDTFLEGCIGETVAALEASEALAQAAFPVVRQVLEQVAEDEARHAALAWRFVAWGVAQAPALIDSLRERLELELVRAEQTRAALAQHAPKACDALGAGGLLSDMARAELRQQALRELVVPCLAALQRPAPADVAFRALQMS